jgi:hypothetical protein
MKQIPERVVTGGLVGQGVENLLGRPQLAPLALVIREAVQNSWDARKRKRRAKLHFSIRVRDLAPAEEKLFRTIFSQDGAQEPRATNSLAAELYKKQRIRVLELADFGTTGLSGQTRPDQPVKDGTSRFVNFMFDFGRAHEESGDGGTYGFGRSSLYAAGRASLILLDSLTDDGGASERRVMACRIGPSFEVSSGWGSKKGRFSGRHFWGRENGGVPQPLVGRDADKVSEGLGLPKRTSAAQSGTTVLIPWPLPEFDDGAEIERTLLHHLWPKMVDAEGRPAIDFTAEVDGRKFPVRDPATTEEYRLFVRALELARTAKPGPGVEVISTLRPIHRTGYLGVAEGMVRVSAAPAFGASDDEDETGANSSALNSVALMRPSELVVRYLPVSGTERAGRSWAGVFICEDDPLVRTAFAQSEPPAHDDWVSNRLKDKTKRYIVRKTRDSLIPDAVRRALGVNVLGPQGEVEDGPSLAGVSARFSATFLSGDGQGAANTSEPSRDTGNASRNGSNGRGGSGSHRRARVSQPELLRLEMRDAVPRAIFGARVQGAALQRVRLRVVPEVHAEGDVDTLPQGLKAPIVAEWRGGTRHGSDCVVNLPDNGQQQLEIEVEFRGNYGVTLDCVVIEEAEE